MRIGQQIVLPEAQARASETTLRRRYLPHEREEENVVEGVSDRLHSMDCVTTTYSFTRLYTASTQG